MARKGILSTGTSDSPTTGRRAPAGPRGAVGALQSSLTKLQENAVQDLAPDLIHDAGVTDRLGTDAEADQTLQDSLRQYGQQVPVLVRPHHAKPGEYEIVYGRRRLRALKALGMPVKAMVRHLDDHALVLAQGQENTARRDLSFIEKASFAAQLESLGYERPTIAAALSIDMPMVSRMLRTGRAFEIDFLKQIGSAPGIGRDRWLKLAEAMEVPANRDRALDRLPALDGINDSDVRFEQVLSWATHAPAPKAVKPALPRARKVLSPHGFALAKVKRSENALTLTIPASDGAGFADWMNANAEEVMLNLHARWMSEQAEDPET
ncbi:plasmid partitioning protein RepB [Sagittula sp. NFXS13]|uniref:plasmid partitioning protein RepB n=1 Tax=Sagittula sp. NFXS13 TaxID=2819095 RepID=UPI0032E050BA